MCKVSIIVPVYEVEEKSFHTCIKSLRNQTLKDVEFLFVDDCGKTSSIDIVHGYEEKDPRIRVIKNQQNMGAGASRNRGIQEARGEYIGFLDADDYVDTEFYGHLYEKALNTGAQIVKGNVIVESLSESVPASWKGDLNEKISLGLSKGNPLFTLFRHQHWSAIYSANYLRENNVQYGNTRISEDVTFLLKATLPCRAFAIQSNTFYHYNLNNEGSLSNTSIKRNLIDYATALTERIRFLSQSDLPNDLSVEQYLRSACNRILDLGREFAIANTSYTCAVTVVIPVYNGETHIHNMLTYMTQQTLKDIEILCVDDGSTDGTREIIAQFAQNDARIKYIYQENAGAGTARNVGLTNAKGEFFACLDADDYYEPHMLEVLYSNAKANNADITICKYRQIDHRRGREQTNLGFFSSVPSGRVFSGDEVPNLLSSVAIGPTNKMYRSDFVLKSDLRYSATHISNDVFFNFATLINAKRILCIPEILSTYHQYSNPNSITSRRSLYLEEAVFVMLGVSEWAYQENIDKIWIDQFARIAVISLSYNSQFGYNKKYLDAIKTFVITEPWASISADQLKKWFYSPNQSREELTRLKEKLAACSEEERPFVQNQIQMLESKIDNARRVFKIIDNRPKQAPPAREFNSQRNLKATLKRWTPVPVWNFLKKVFRPSA